jgi:hypothetical protein
MDCTWFYTKELCILKLNTSGIFLPPKDWSNKIGLNLVEKNFLKQLVIFDTVTCFEKPLDGPVMSESWSWIQRFSL